MKPVRTFILLGQYGLGTGMLALKQPLSAFGLVTAHQWYDSSVISEINRLSGRIAIPAFSLGANQLGFISQNVRRRIELGVAYDPSRQSPLTRIENGVAVQSAPMFNRLLCYYNLGTWFFGGAKYVGKNVEVTEISSFHISPWGGVADMPELHRRTIEAVRKLSEQP